MNPEIYPFDSQNTWLKLFNMACYYSHYLCIQNSPVMPATKSIKYTHDELKMEVIKEARKSIPEHTDKTDPLVGAIIASPDGEILDSAHRG